ncbi:MAG: glutamate synthase subunit beta [Anaerolineales bacterium]|nr:glutamate synthase subunit beta [Anaerolineales bacterium]
MAKATGFMEFQRELPSDRTPGERVGDWMEFHEHFDDGKLQRQGARCMDCGTPFCHTGVLIRGVTLGCPIHNLIPEWNDLVYRGQWRQAYERLQKTNNFPEFTGRVCPAPCEGSCTLGINEPPVTIKTIEQAIIDRAFTEGWVVARLPLSRTGKRVAVVGSGPAGLACADQLNQAGHAVTVFERADRFGGLLVYGIPNMKLDKSIVKRRLDLLMAEGIKFVNNVEIGRNYPAEKLLGEFDAAVLCCGATQPRDLTVEGRELSGIHFAMEYLHGNTKHLLDRQHGDVQVDGGFAYPYITAEGKDVVVIGGGDTGTDCVATALRQGCRGLVQLEILPCPPDSRPPDNPWPEWPRIFRTDYGQEECQALRGADPRRFAVMTRRFLGDARERVCGVETVQVEWVTGGEGRASPRPLPGSEQTHPADLVLLAMGFLGPEETILKQLDLASDARGNIQTNNGKYATRLPGLFAAGDMRRGQSLVVWAIQEGCGAAREVDRYLMGISDLP